MSNVSIETCRMFAFDGKVKFVATDGACWVSSARPYNHCSSYPPGSVHSWFIEQVPVFSKLTLKS